MNPNDYVCWKCSFYYDESQNLCPDFGAVNMSAKIMTPITGNFYNLKIPTRAEYIKSANVMEMSKEESDGFLGFIKVSRTKGK